MPKSKFLFTIIFAITAGILVAVIVMAWTNPTANPPSGSGAISYYNGNVGIGTTAPSQKLHLNTSTGNILATIQNGNSTGYTALQLYNNIDQSYLLYGGSAYTGYAGANSLNIIGGGGPIAFFNTAAEAMRITSSGNVGIGTAAPAWKLDVVGGSMRADGYVAGGQLCMGYATPDCRPSWASAGIQGSGTTNYLPKFTGSGTIGNSTIFDDGTTVTVNSTYIRGATYGFGGMYVLNTPDGSCRRTNPYTGGCSCPAGFTPGWASDGADFHSWFCYK